MEDMNVELPKARIYSDGSSKGNSDGPGGYGVIVHYLTEDDKVDHLMEFTEGFEVTTNNRMELMGVIIGLESFKEPYEIDIYSDSKYVVDAFNLGWIDNWQSNGWKTASNHPVRNLDLWKRLLEAKEPHRCKFIWVKGHDGHPENERCDYLAQCSANGMKFKRGVDGRLVENKITLKKDTGLSVSDIESPKLTLNSVVSEYVSTIAKNMKDYTVTINGAKFIFDEEGNIAPHPDEKIEKCKAVVQTLEKLKEDNKFAELLKDILFTGESNSLLCNFMDTMFSNFFTGNKTIPLVSVERESDK